MSLVSTFVCQTASDAWASGLLRGDSYRRFVQTLPLGVIYAGGGVNPWQHCMLGAGGGHTVVGETW